MTFIDKEEGSGKTLYHIVYVDGDEEDFSLDQCRHGISLAKEKGLT